jgi:NTE family protein
VLDSAKVRRPAAPAGPSFAPALDAAATPEFPCGPSDAPEEVGLALSGGGYRATLFHLGALWRLNELGWLPRLDRISSVSGGSLMVGILAWAWPRFSWDDAGRARNFEELVVRPTLKFTGRRIDAFVIALGLIPLVNPADVMAWLLHRVLTRRLRIRQLPDRPRFVINATHLATGVSWRFSKPYMGDYRLGVVCDPDLPVARAIAASAAFPPFVAPLVLDLRGMRLEKVAGGDLFDDPRYAALKRRVLLLDGGVYDNLGIETVEGRCRIALASDAGGNLEVDARRFRYGFWWPLIRRTLELEGEVDRAQRRRALVDRAQAARELHEKTGKSDSKRVTEHAALWRTSLELAGHPMLPSGWTVAPGWREHLSTLSTRMWPMSESDRRHLVNWGYLACDVIVRKYVPELVGADAPQSLPFRDADFAQPPPG